MSMTKPIGLHNAIDKMAFAIVFNRNFEPEEIAKMLEIKEVMPKPLSVVNELTGFWFNPKEANTPPAEVLGGFELSSEVASESDGPAWVLRTHLDSIYVICSDFTSWTDFWGMIKSFVLPIFPKIDLASNNVKHLALQCADVFETEDISSYNFLDVFNADSIYLNENIKSAGTFWHVNQGWFSSLDSNVSLLHNLNISLATSEDNAHGTLIDHSVVLRVKDGSMSDFFDVSLEGQVAEVMKAAYESNKEIMRNLLNKNMLSKIGM